MRVRHLVVCVACACSLSSDCDNSSSKPPLAEPRVSITRPEFYQLCPGEDVQIGPDNEATPFKLEPESRRPWSGPPAGWELLLYRISINSSPRSSPPSVFVSGRVICSNTGFPLERVSVFIGREGEPLRLAGMTNADGDFKFRLWIKDGMGVQIPPDFSSFLYVQQIRGPSGVYRRYSFQQLRKLSEDRVPFGE